MVARLRNTLSLNPLGAGADSKQEQRKQTVRVEANEVPQESPGSLTLTAPLMPRRPMRTTIIA